MSDDSTPQSGFAAFLPAEYRGEFSRDWLMGLSPFSDDTCTACYSVQRGQWVTFGPQLLDESQLRCERAL